jgi:general stress protein 26
MDAPEPVAELDERFSSPGATAQPWTEVLAQMQRAEIFWLSTVRRDGRPHVTPLPAMWLDGAMHFCTGPEEQKARNLAGNAHCVLTTGGDRFLEGTDIVIEGEAVRVTDEAMLRRLADMWEAKLDWRFDVVDGAFRDPESSAADSRGTANVFAVAPDKVLAWSKGEPFSQTRYRLPRSRR